VPTEHTRRARQPSGAPAPAAGSGGTVSLKGKPAVSLSKHCLWELADGSKGVVQALGNAFGSLQAPLGA